MNNQDIINTIDQFVAAKIAQEVGFTGFNYIQRTEYLLSQFLSPNINPKMMSGAVQLKIDHSPH